MTKPAKIIVTENVTLKILPLVMIFLLIDKSNIYYILNTVSMYLYMENIF